MTQLKTITVRDLIEALEGEAPDALVVVGADYGDYHHTEQALPLRGRLEEVLIEESAYSHSGFAVATTDDLEDEDVVNGGATYLVLR